MEKLKAFVRTHKLGLRIVKTGIAVTVCLLISYALKLQYPFYAVIATVIAMGNSIDVSFKAGKNRMIGTFVGALTGMAFAMMMPGNPGLCGIGIIVTLYLCHLFKLNNSAPIACIVFSAIMLNLRDAVPWEYALGRITDTLVGILVALAVNLLIMPPNCAGKIKEQYEQLRSLVREAQDNAEKRFPLDCKAIDAVIGKLTVTISQYIAEAKFLRGNDEKVFYISCKLATFREVLHELISVENLEQSGPRNQQAQVAYEYHIERLHALCEVALETL